MTTNESFDERLSSWLRDTSDRRVPDHLDEVMIVTAATRQRPWWSSPERWLPMDLTSRASTLAFPRMGRLLLVGLLILVLVALAIVAVGSRQQRIPPPFGPAANGSILSWDVAGDILASDPDGSNRRPILSDPAFDFAPWYSHDGTRFVFWRRVSEHESEVMVANADGSGVRSLSRGPLTDADWYEWSPGDDLVAVVHSHEGQRIVTIIDAKGSAPSRDLDLGELDVDNNVYWLPPTGDELVFTARETPDSKDSGLYAVKRDGMGLRLLGPVATDHYFDLAVASDGKRIAYSNIEADQSGNGIGWHIHLRDIQTGADRQVTFDPRASGEVDEHGPMFSPDGTQILLWTQDGDTGRLAIAPSDGRGLTRPLGPPFLWSGDYGYGFAPDGRTANLNIGAGTTWLIDLPSGKGTRLDESIPNFSTWQRLAQPLP
jgi:hypothetical protein